MRHAARVISPAHDAVTAAVHRETAAWDALDADALVTIFHPDMVWVWPPTERDHDPLTWAMPMGRFNAGRWHAGWSDLFSTHELIRNHRELLRVEVTPEGDGAFAVVDIDTHWKSRTDGSEMRWKGRTCKVYTLCQGAWKMITQTGVLTYD